VSKSKRCSAVEHHVKSCDCDDLPHVGSTFGHTALPCCPRLTECTLGRRSHSLWSRRSSSSGVTARRRTSVSVPGAPLLPPHPESPPAPAASLPRSEQPQAAAHPADVVPDAVADAESAAAVTQGRSTQPLEPGGGIDGQQVNQASPTAGHGPEAHRRDSTAAAAAEHDGALPDTSENAEAPAFGSSPPRVPPLRLGSLSGGPARDLRDGGGNVHSVDAGSRSAAAAAVVMARCWADLVMQHFERGGLCDTGCIRETKHPSPLTYMHP